MRQEFETYFDQNWLMSPWAENGVLFTAEYAVLAKDTADGLNHWQIMKAVTSQIVGGRWQSADPNEPFSHDNFSAVCVLYKILGWEKKFEWGHWCRHPRDLVFYMYACNNKILNLLGNLLFFIPFICMVEACLNSHYKQIDGASVLATDGKLLTWLRINAFNIPLTKRLCDYIIKRKYGGWASIFDIYFKDPNHPNRVLAHERGI